MVTATQMLESMAKNPRPTRAEVSDVANAVYDGTSAIMLSGETSVGKYPVEAVRTMSTIAENAEKTIHYDRRRATRLEFQNMDVAGDAKTLAIAHATCSTTADLGAKCIVAFTEGGSTARAVSTYRPGAPIIAATPNEKTCHRLSMSWGVTPCWSAIIPSPAPSCTTCPIRLRSRRSTCAWATSSRSPRACRSAMSTTPTRCACIS